MIGSAASIYPIRDRTAWILAQRPVRGGEPDPNVPNGIFLERERLVSGEVVSSGVALLTNRECPWKCLMCDLWQHTTRESVPLGAIPRQIEHAVRHWSETGALPRQVKLYNSGSFFDPAAIPPDDYATVAQQVAFARNVVVESHPLLVGDRALRLRDLLAGRLEVAMGLETAHPETLEKLNKKFTLAQFSRAAEMLANEKIALRVFLLVHPPFLPGADLQAALSAKGAADEFAAFAQTQGGSEIRPYPQANRSLAWLLKSVEFAFECGATAVTLIPTRGGNGAMERLREAGEWSPPTLRDLEAAHREALAVARGRGRVFADTWGLDAVEESADTAVTRRRRIEAMNLTQRTDVA